jgi:hypothetical protein
VRQFRAAEQAYDRLIELLPDRPMLKVEKATFITLMKTGDDGPARSAITALPASMAGDKGLLSARLFLALADRDWPQSMELIGKLEGGGDNTDFAYAGLVPFGCYSILIARLEAEQPHANLSFAEIRDQLNRKVQRSPENADLLSSLAVVDALLYNKEAAISEAKRALLYNKEAAISEAKRAVETSPISKDAMAGPGIAINLAVVYAWTNELDLAFQTLAPLTKTPNGIYYGQLKLDPLWDPIRKDPRFEKLLAELAPKD